MSILKEWSRAKTPSRKEGKKIHGLIAEKKRKIRKIDLGLKEIISHRAHGDHRDKLKAARKPRFAKEERKDLN